MKVSKWVNFESDVDVEIGLTEITAAIGEAWERIKPEKWEENPTRNDVIAAMSRSLIFFKALKDEQIASLTGQQRSLLRENLTALAARFELGGLFKPANADVTGGREAEAGSTETEGRLPGEAIPSGQSL